MCVYVGVVCATRGGVVSERNGEECGDEDVKMPLEKVAAPSQSRELYCDVSAARIHA
jgi:hypothetical protein